MKINPWTSQTRETLLKWLPGVYEDLPQLAAIRKGSFKSQAGRTACPSFPPWFLFQSRTCRSLGLVKCQQPGPKAWFWMWEWFTGVFCAPPSATDFGVSADTVPGLGGAESMGVKWWLLFPPDSCRAVG